MVLWLLSPSAQGENIYQADWKRILQVLIFVFQRKLLCIHKTSSEAAVNKELCSGPLPETRYVRGL